MRNNVYHLRRHLSANDGRLVTECLLGQHVCTGNIVDMYCKYELMDPIRQRSREQTPVEMVLAVSNDDVAALAHHLSSQ